MRRWPTCYQTAQAFAQNMSSGTDARRRRLNTGDSTGCTYSGQTTSTPGGWELVNLDW
jgi:hypothetical protein